MQRGQTIAIALKPGYMLEVYRIDAVLGKGGFAITYLATDTRLDKQFAIKELLPDGIATRIEGNTVVAQSQSQENDFRWAVDSFLQEAKVLASFEHPNIVSVLRLFEANGTAYMVMPLIQGKTIKDTLLERGKLPYEEVHHILYSLLNGLSAVHDAGVLHRDIKPENIFLTADNQPIMIDFGAARQQVSEKSLNITSIITPGYAPIEQYSTDSRYQGAWSDIYAMAAVAYHMITGKRPAAASERNDSQRNLGSDPITQLTTISPPGYPTHFLSAIDQALIMNESQRPEDITSWIGLLGKPESTHSRSNYSLDDDQATIKVALPPNTDRPIPVATLEAQKSSKKPLIISTLVATILLIAGALYIFGTDFLKSQKKKLNANSSHTSKVSNTDQITQQVNEFLSDYSKGFWTGPDAWYLSDTRITDEFAVAMHRALINKNSEALEVDPISTLSGSELNDSPVLQIQANNIEEKAGRALVTINDKTTPPLQLIMVRQGGQWLVDGRTGGKYQLNAQSDIFIRLDEKELLLQARKRKRNLIKGPYGKEIILRGVVITQPIRTLHGKSRQQPFIKFDKSYLDIDLSSDQRKETGIKTDRYYSTIPLFYEKAARNNFKDIESAIGSTVVITGRLVHGNALPDTHPVGFFAEKIKEQLGIPPLGHRKWIFPDSHTRRIEVDDLKGLNDNQLWRARNEIYARKGYIFNTSKGRLLIKSLGDDFKPKSNDQSVIWNLLNDIEKENLNILRNFEGKPLLKAPSSSDQTLRDAIIAIKSTTPSKIYLGKYGIEDAIYSIQWLPGKMLRGSIFLYQTNKELHLYGSNFQEGVIQLEIWHGDELHMNAQISKQTKEKAITWSGHSADASKTPLNYSRSLIRPSSDIYTSLYEGQVGSSSIEVTLDWLRDGTVQGNYYSKNTGNIYQLAGDNTLKGFLYLDEFTSNNLSARALLTKESIDGKVHWKGSLFNIDGRVKPLSFVKKP